MLVVLVTLVAIRHSTTKLAPEVVNDVNPSIPLAHRNRFNPSIIRPNMVTGFVFMIFLFMVLMLMYYKSKFIPSVVENLSPVGNQICIHAFVSLLATMVYPISVYINHEEARNHLKTLFSSFKL